MQTVFDKLGNQKELLEDNDIQSENDYIKFPDGTMICWFNVWLEAGTELKEWSFPEPFISAPKCFAFHEYAHQAYGFINIQSSASDINKILNIRISSSGSLYVWMSQALNYGELVTFIYPLKS